MKDSAYEIHLTLVQYLPRFNLRAIQCSTFCGGNFHLKFLAFMSPTHVWRAPICLAAFPIRTKVAIVVELNSCELNMCRLNIRELDTKQQNQFIGSKTLCWGIVRHIDSYHSALDSSTGGAYKSCQLGNTRLPTREYRVANLCSHIFRKQHMAVTTAAFLRCGGRF
jgi:hypothetical protein